MKRNCLVTILFLLGMGTLWSQPQVYPWGSISGILLDGELMELNSSMVLIGRDWPDVLYLSEKEVGQYRYGRRGNTQTTDISTGPFRFDQNVEDLGAGQASLRLYCLSEQDTVILGAFLLLELPSSRYDANTLRLVDARPLEPGKYPGAAGELQRGATWELRIGGPARDLVITVNESTEVIAAKDPGQEDSPVRIYFALAAGQMDAGTSAYRSFQISATGIPDFSPFTLVLDDSIQGRPFRGFGGNFRLQNPDSDPGVIDFCLQHMDVRYGRVEMPWNFWQPGEDEDPIAKAEAGELHPRVREAMEMAQRLHKLGMPVILSDWSAPRWAVTGPTGWGPRPGGLRGNPLDPEKAGKIYKSIADFIQYAKDHYGFEYDLFSFNESDLGINVRQTPEEHARLIRELGAYLKSRGLGTRLLLGDTADANGWPFTRVAMEDPEARPYIGAVSFHSWRGYTDENLRHWFEVAERTKLPLLVGEGSMDAGAWLYPDIFSEPVYAMEEMNLYLRILKICQPEAILQWQLTADYSPMTGGSVFGQVNRPLEPTRRFWNFKQIADMPEDLYFMPVEADRDNVTCAALGDREKGMYMVHLVNNGATRTAILKGLPSQVRFIQIFVTNEKESMAQHRRIFVRNGEATFLAEANSFITLLVDAETPSFPF